MNKNIQTANAKLDLITKFLDYANVADASYAMLQYIWENAEQDENDKVNKADKLTFGDKLIQDIEIKNNEGKLLYIKPKNTNTAYACAIQARFEQSKIIRIESKYCIPFTDTYFFHKEITLDNDISRVGLNDTLSKRTIDFVNRFKLLKHQPNTTSGFSATLFEDTKDNNQKIIVIRGTEPKEAK